MRPGRLQLPSPDIFGILAAHALLLRGTALLLSLQPSRVIPKDHQLVHVIMAMERPCVRMLIADEASLGKPHRGGSDPS